MIIYLIEANIAIIYLMDANIACITEDHFIAVFTIRLQTQHGWLYDAVLICTVNDIIQPVKQTAQQFPKMSVKFAVCSKHI